MVVGRFAGQVAVAVSQRWQPDGDSAGVVCEVFIGLELSVQGDFFLWRLVTISVWMCLGSGSYAITVAECGNRCGFFFLLLLPRYVPHSFCVCNEVLWCLSKGLGVKLFYSIGKSGVAIGKSGCLEPGSVTFHTPHPWVPKRTLAVAPWL